MTDIPLHPMLAAVTERIEKRSAKRRAAYLDLMRAQRPTGPARKTAGEANLAHAAAACSVMEKMELFGASWPNIGIVTAYNDMLSAHQPFERFPDLIRQAARESGATAQVAGGVPAMCDGVTQGRAGMELSLISRDVIAMATAVSLSHDVFDAALYLGVCDKIVPGLVIGALRFGWIPAIFVPAGPMPSGIPNPEKAKVRQLFAEGKVGREALLEAEAKSYHAPGTCTFYGTANSNQMLMEMMGLHLPGAAFVNPNTPLRDALTKAAVARAAAISSMREHYTPICDVIDARAMVNGVVGLLATGGSTNHALHLPAMARAAGIDLNWDDISDLSSVTPLLCRIYPNGVADVNHFHAAGGMGFLVRELAGLGLIHLDTKTIAGEGGLTRYIDEPVLQDGVVAWRAAPLVSGDTSVLRPGSDPFDTEGGLRILKGPLGRAVVKTSAVKPEHRVVTAPARVFHDQSELLAAFKAGEITGDVVAVVRFQGPRANGMPELHKLTPNLSSLQDKGHKVALVTDGRMSGASGKVPAAIHVTPEAAMGGAIGKVRDGDLITLNAETGELLVHVDPDVFEARELASADLGPNGRGLGREMFHLFRSTASVAEEGGGVFGDFSEMGV